MSWVNGTFHSGCPGSLSGVSPAVPGDSLPRNTSTSGSGQQKLSPPTPFADISLGSDSVNCCFTNKDGPSSSSHKGPLDD